MVADLAIWNNIIIYTGAIILGDITIGDNSIIGTNSVVTNVIHQIGGFCKYS